MIGRRWVLRVLGSAPFLGVSARWGAVKAVGPTSAVESASSYRKAFAWLQTLNAEEHERIRNWRTMRLDGAARALIERSGPALAEFRRGAGAVWCDWADEPLPTAVGKDRWDVSKLSIGRIALLRARLLIADGRGNEALDDAFAVAAFGRHLGNEGVLILRLFQCAQENEAIAVVAQGLPSFGRDALATLSERTRSLPPSVRLIEVLRQEARFIAAFWTERLQTLPARLTVDSLVAIDCTRKESEAVIQSTGGDRAKLPALIADVEPRLAGMAAALGTPFSQLLKTADAYIQKVRDVNPLAVSAVEASVGMRYAVERTEVLWTMLHAGALKVLGRDDDFQGVADPHGNGPFEVRPIPGGFELRSALRFEDRLQAVLIVGGM